MDEKILKAVYDKFASKGHLDPSGLLELLKKLDHVNSHSPNLRNEEVLKNVSQENILSAFAFIDENGDGYISYDEFKKWWVSESRYEIFSRQKLSRLQKAYALYKKYDKGKGLNLINFTSLMNEMNVEYEDENESFNALDANRDGHITFREFIDWLKWLN